MTDPGRLGQSGPGLTVPDETVPDEPGRRAAYRAWVREHHPDRGGDPTAFAQGLQAWQHTLRHPSADDMAGGALPVGSLTFHRARRPNPLSWWAARRAERARPARVR